MMSGWSGIWLPCGSGRVCSLLYRTTRSVVPTEAGERLLRRLGPALNEVEAALDVVNVFRDRPAGTLRLNVPVRTGPLLVSVGTATDLAVEAAIAGTGIIYLFEDWLRPHLESGALTAAAPAYLDRSGRPEHPHDLLGHACLCGRFTSRTTVPWEFERDGEVVRVDPSRFSRAGGYPSRVPSSTTRGAIWCPRLCGRFSTSSRPRQATAEATVLPTVAQRLVPRRSARAATAQAVGVAAATFTRTKQGGYGRAADRWPLFIQRVQPDGPVSASRGARSGSRNHE